jgi:ferredoxin
MADHLAGIETCALCPRLCRHACPAAEGTRREAAVPAVIAEVLLGWTRGRLPDEVAREASTLCVDCGRCRDVCHLHRPLPALLRSARAALLPTPVVAAPADVEGDGELVAIEADARRWAPALAARLDRPVARLATSDGLGGALRGFPGWDGHAARLRERLGGRRAVVADGASAGALGEAGVDVVWLHVLLPDLADGARASCALGAQDCCGGAWPLAEHHPADARRMADRYGTAAIVDARCRGHLVGARDAVDRLLEGT